LRLLSSQVSPQLKQTDNHPLFGCRIEGVMGPQQPPPSVQQQSDQFVWSTLVSDANSLRQESKKRPPKDGYLQTLDIEDLSGVLRKQGNLDGWGIAAYPAASLNHRPLVLKSPTPAATDIHYPTAAAQELRQHPNILLAHVRLASPEFNQIQETNVHPFTYGNWSFIHNGAVSGATSPPILEKIAQNQNVIAAGPKGTTDSERSFYYFLSRLHDAAGTVDSEKIPLQVKQMAFAQSIQDLVDHSKPTYKPLKGEVLGTQGHILIQPAANFILSDGQNLFAFKKTLDLFLGQKTLSNGQKTYIVSSEKSERNDPAVKWMEIPDNHLLTLTWDKNGNTQVDMEPLPELTQKNALK